MLQCYLQFLRPATFLFVLSYCYFLSFFYTHLMQDIFKVDIKDLQKLIKFYRESPKQFRYATAGVLNFQAFQTRKYDIENLQSSMIIRDNRFLQSSLRVDKTRALPIERQMSVVYSVRNPRFSGWKEQEEGSKLETKRAATVQARGGNRHAKVQPSARFSKSNKFYKPSQFQGNALKNKYMFMMRVLNTRKGGEFIIDEKIQTNNGALGKGLYRLRNHKITRLQKLENIKRPHKNQWRTRSINKLRNTNIMPVWEENIRRQVERSGLSK